MSFEKKNYGRNYFADFHRVSPAPGPPKLTGVGNEADDTDESSAQHFEHFCVLEQS